MLTPATATSVTVTAGTATKLGITQTPVGGASGAALATQPLVAIQDASGNTITTDNTTQVTVAISAGVGGALGGTLTRTAAAGIVTFDDVTLAGTVGENYDLQFTSSPVLTPATATSVTVTAGTATKLGITIQPVGGTSGAALTTQPSVAIQDAQGNTVITDNTTQVSVAISSGVGGSLGGTTTVTAVSGVVDFTTVTLTGTVGEDYVFQFTSNPVLTPVNSSVVNLTGPDASLNLNIDGLYLTQAAQNYSGTTPLVAGRDAYLRTFGLANQGNTETPPVRVRFYDGASLVRTDTIPAPTGSVPTSADESTLASSWNLLVPGSLVQPGLAVLADVDPAAAVVEADETDNAFPVSGTPVAVDVRTLPTFDVRLIPILQQTNGLQGNVTAGNASQFLSDATTLLPIGAYASDVRAVYTTMADTLKSDDSNSAWTTILGEILALKAVDGSSQYYYGVVKTSYTSGVAGYGYVGGTARTGIGWDYLPSGSGVMAHELGHNMSLAHAPCGGASGPDPSYPYAGASIGMWGLDVSTLALKDPATYVDLMSYCSPEWVSDYNWAKMIAYRESGPNNILAGSEGRGLLVWGRISEQGMVLEPAFVVDAPITLHPPGPYRLDAIGIDGSVLASRTFAPVAVGDSPTPQAAFAFVIPMERVLDLELATLRVTGPLGSIERRAGLAAPPTPSTVVEQTTAGRYVLRWDAASNPMVMVRDTASGQVLSFARGGRFDVPPGIGGLQLTYSDGVRSLREDRILQ